MMCAVTRIEGCFSKQAYPAWKNLSFDRIINNDESGRRHNHYQGNLQVVLYVCNNARGAAPMSEMTSWLNALRESPVLSESITSANTQELTVEHSTTSPSSGHISQQDD